jgi:hypothetical protein
MISGRLVAVVALVAACGGAARAPAPSVAPPAAEASVAPCARGVYRVEAHDQEVRAADVASCTTRLDAAVGDAIAGERQELATLDEQIAAADGRIQAAQDARDHFLDEQQVLRSVGLEQQLGLMRQLVAKARKPAAADVAEVARLEALLPQDQALKAAIDAAMDEEAKLRDRRAELLLSPPAQVLEACATCPSR